MGSGDKPQGPVGDDKSIADSKEARALSQRVASDRVELAQAGPQDFKGNYGRRWFEPQSASDMRGRATTGGDAARPGWDKIPLDLAGVNTANTQLWVNRNGRFAILTTDGKPSQINLSPDGTPITIGDQKFIVNPPTRNDPASIEWQTNSGTERIYANGAKDRFDRQGKLIDRNQSVKGANGEVFSPHYSPDGKLDHYEVNRDGQTIETGIKENGRLQVKRLGNDGQMHTVGNLRDRTDVIMRPNGRLDYLDKDGYGLPDENGRRTKRSDRTVMGLAESSDGRQVQFPINPIQSVRLGDGRQIDYTYAGAGQGDGLNSYTIKNKDGQIIEFAHVVPASMSSSGQSLWLEYRAKPGQAPMPEETVKDLHAALTQTDPQEIQRSLQWLKTKPLADYLTARAPGSETRGVYLDQVTGKQVNTYADGSSLVRSEDGETISVRKDPRTGEALETTSDGLTRRRALDSDPSKNTLDRTTTTSRTPGGGERLEMFHMRSGNQAFMKVGYGDDGVTPNEIFFATPPNKAIRMAPDSSNPKNWVEYETKDDRTWVRSTDADGKLKAPIPMRVDLAGQDTRVNGDKVPPGSIIISMRPDDPDRFYTRIYTPQGLEVHEYPGPARQRQVKPSDVQTMPDGKTIQEVYAPPGPARPTVVDPRDPRVRRAPYQPGLPGSDPRLNMPRPRK